MKQEILAKLYALFLDSKGAFTDTRNPVEGGVFFALSGPNFNGNEYAGVALDCGAVAAVIDEEAYRQDDRFILVDDVLHTLQELARHHRRQFNGSVLALTGSNGKTTTKELIMSVLSAKYNLTATQGNLNNHIGVPLTLLRISSQTEMVVIEMGANHVGEIALLCAIAEPDYGLITNIGRAHIEGFGSVEAIKRGKGELYDYLCRTDGVVFVNSSDRILMEMAVKCENPVLYSKKSDFSYINFKGAHPFVEFESALGKVIKTHLYGAYNFSNAAAAYCIGEYFGISTTAVEQALVSYIPDNNRSQVIRKGSNTILLDAYNANPDSMKASLAALDEIKGKRKVVILGDMLELGNTSVEEHRQLGILISEMPIAEALFCGELIRIASEQLPHSQYFKHKSDLEEYLVAHPVRNSVILIKASRGLGLETLLSVIN